MGQFDTSRDEWPILMARAQAGDQQAYTRLLTVLVPVIRSMVRKQIDDAVLTEDVIQDVLLAVHRVRHTYDPACPFLPWLKAIAQARSIDALRRRGRQRHWEVAEEESLMQSGISPARRSGGIPAKSCPFISTSYPPDSDKSLSMST